MGTNREIFANGSDRTDAEWARRRRHAKARQRNSARAKTGSTVWSWTALF
jgi:hypothetical protein